MPTYEYKCNTCGQRFDKIQRFSDAPLTECPDCGAEVRRVIHSTGIIFKGAGWYITDNRKSSDGGDKGEGKGKGDGAGADNGKSEQGATPSTDKATDKVAATAAGGKNSTTTEKAAASSDS